MTPAFPMPRTIHAILALATCLVLSPIRARASEPPPRGNTKVEPGAAPVEPGAEDQPGSPGAERTRDERRAIAAAAGEAFAQVHDGWSADEVLIHDTLHARFLEACRERIGDLSELEWNWTLLNLRKAGRLARATRRETTASDELSHAAEIAARLAHDRHHATIDRVLCDPDLRAELDRAAREAAPEASAYELRKAVLRLRKARRLRPELIVQIADWGREVLTLPATEIQADATRVPSRPGIYILRDQTGYLYIGESQNLRSRVQKHLDHSDRKSLAHYLWEHGSEQITVELHAFDPQSDAKREAVRRAYESELIASRKPRFNIAP